MQKITTFLTFNDQAEEAVKFYTSLFKDAKITNTSYYPDFMEEMAGKVLAINFEINGQEFIALNGGPQFKFDQGVSLMVNCESQEEIDHLWAHLSDGGQTQACGWLIDRYGLTWQITPTILGEMLTDPDKDRAARVMKVMMEMVKFDIAALTAARDGD